jgi:isoleucyl-tRNA synthetase
LPAVHLAAADAETRAALEEQVEAIAAELNVKRVELASDLSALEEDHLALDFRRAGPVLRKELDAVSSQIRELTDQERATAIAAIREDRSVRLPGWTEDLPPEIFTFERRPATGMSIGDTQAGVIVALDTRLDEALIREGWARDVVRHTQVLRRDAGLEVSDRIRLGIATGDADLDAAVREYVTTIAGEVLADDVEFTALDDGAARRECEIDNRALVLTLQRT